ncbi:MAG: putative iron-sulfur protein [Gemmatimonadetes bacterium]|nr:putative iron-sulfur protein [Gemmatimonadota bacterium]
MSGFEVLASVADLPDGALMAAVRSDGAEICLFNHRGTIGAVGNVCTHAEFLLSDGTLRNDGSLECVWHGARFDCRTGKVCRGPAEDPVAVFPVRIEGGRVLVGPRVE